jgi:LCP family protein required for cell wall assembly
MESQESTPSIQPNGPRSPDRLTKALVWVALVLIAIVAALSIDLWADREGEEGVTLAAEQALPAPRPTSLPLPTATPSPAPVTPPPCVAPDDWGVHTVLEGDTLYALAQQYGTEVETLMLVNCLDANTILIGQALHVPGPTSGAVAAASTETPAEQSPAAASAGTTVAQPSTALVDLQSGFPENYLNIVLLGSDKRENSATWRTDTMIILSIDTESDFIRLLSIPRDLWVNIPGHGPDRINTADLWGELEREGGGPEVVKQTIYQNLGIPIHYYVRVDFDGFTKIIDAIGGLDIDVECPLSDIELVPGMQHMDGELALLYARSRITTNDFDRSRRQRKLLMALWEQGLSVGIIPRLPSLSKAMAGTVQTDIPFDQVIALAYKGLQLKPSHIFSNSIGPWQVENWTTPQGAAVLLPVDEEVQKLFAMFYAPPDMDFLQRISETRVQILNGTQRPDAEQLAATTLRWSGFQIARTGLADSSYYTESQVIVYNAEPDVAETAAQLLDLPRSSLQYQADPSKPVDMLILLGADYDPCR